MVAIGIKDRSTTEGHQLCLGKESLIKDVTARQGHFKTNRSLLEKHSRLKKKGIAFTKSVIKMHGLLSE